MPLYDNILPSSREGRPKNDGSIRPDVKLAGGVVTPNASMKLLQDHLMSKKRSKQANQPPTKVHKTNDKVQPNMGFFVQKNSEFDWDLDDEYDPMMPNSYEILQLEYLKAEEQRQLKKRSAGKIDLSILDALERFDDNLEETSVINRGTAIAPPPTLLSSDPSNISANTLGTPKTTPHSQASLPIEKLDGSSAAAKIMAKMGYKAGQGLGRDKQGISVPLEFEQNGSSVGRIVSKSKTPPSEQQQISMTSPESSDGELKVTRVLLLQNMVGPGEVDEDLEMETKEECGKYGEVMKCLIYEIPNKRVPDEEAVRIFVQFKDENSSRKAVKDLDGRYFGGRVVRASFYDENKFDKYILAP